MNLRALPALSTALALAFAGAANAQAPGDADAAFRATTLSISAEGEVKAAPDKATVSLGVQTTAPTAAQAMSDNAQRMNGVIAALRRQGLEGKDVQTAGISLQAQYNYQPNKAPELSGYQASNQVTVTVDDLGKLGPTLDAVTASGANQIEGVNFGLKDPDAAQDQARLKAVKALQARAELYAGAAGYRVGRLVNLSESGGAQPLPFAPKVMAMAARAAAPTPVEPGELTVRVEVTGLYELAR
jgi:hypothetical protein